MSKNWEKIAKEYKKEIENLWKDIESALNEKDYAYRGQIILNKSLKSSQKAVFEIEQFL